MAEKKKSVKTKSEIEEVDEVSPDEESDSIKSEVETKKEELEEVHKTDTDDMEELEDEVKTEEGEKPEKDTSSYFTNSTVYGDSAQAASVEKRFSGKRLLFFLIAIVVSAGIFFAGLMFFNFQFDIPRLSNPFAAPTPSPTPEPTVTPTPEPKVTLSEYSTQVLNGSGVSGAAADVAAILEEEGFENVEAGNADNQDFEDTEVQLKEGVPAEVYSIISKALPSYTVIEGDELGQDSEFDVVVTVGQSKAAEEEAADADSETDGTSQ